MARTVPVYLESGEKRVFAAALDWPGWARAGRTPDEALAALVAAGPRYAAVVQKAAPPFVAPTDVDDLEVVRRLEGGSGTERPPLSTPRGLPGDSGKVVIRV